VDLILVGLNHRTTPVELREKFAFSEEDAGRFLSGLADDPHVAESMLLSTCNRTELYCRFALNGASDEDHAEAMRRFILKGREDSLSPSCFYSFSGVEAVRHLFRVAAGLDSMILGESQVLGQVKDSYRLAGRYGTNGFLINKTLHTAFRVGGRARSETEIATGAVSFSMAAVELSQKIFQDLAKKRALVVGAGEMAALTAEHFTSKRIGKLVFTNRTMEKAAAMAEKFNGETADWNALKSALASSDIVITSTRAPGYIITADMVRAAMHARRNQPIFLIDIAVPRNIDPAAGKIYNVFAHNIDDLKQIIDRNLSRRRAEVPKVEKIIEDEIQDLVKWYRSLSVTPTIKSLVRRAEEIRAAQIEKNIKNFTPEQREVLEAMTKSLVSKLIHIPISKIRECGDDIETTLYRVDAVRDIFDLGNESRENDNEE
jgi:glutamyl-tRNA reductase